MVYRHIYWGLLCVAPAPSNQMTEAVKPSLYLVKVISPHACGTKEEAMEDPMEYCFHVKRGEAPYIYGFAKRKAQDKAGKEQPVFTEKIRQGDWERYRLIRLDKSWKVADGDEGHGRAGRPCGKRWGKLFPAYGCYPLKKAAFSVVAFPDVSGQGKGAGAC